MIQAIAISSRVPKVFPQIINDQSSTSCCPCLFEVARSRCYPDFTTDQSNSYRKCVCLFVQVDFKNLNDICGSSLNDGKAICVPTISNSTGTYLLAQKDNGPTFRYPQAAIKQVMEVNSSTTQDIILEFNSNIKWNFGYSLTERKISSNMYDLARNIS